MDTQDLYTLGSSMLLGLLPFLPTALGKIKERGQPGFYLKLIEQREELLAAKQRQLDDDAPDFVIHRLDEVLQGVDGKIRMKDGRPAGKIGTEPLTLFHYMVAIEGFLVIGTIFSSGWLRTKITGESWESGLRFFEGVLSEPFARFGLLVLIYGFAFYVTGAFKRKAFGQRPDNFGRSATLLGVFNVAFIVTLGAIGVLLALLDDFTNLI
jgi:hypothetical protein